ncbi:hypothetical protein IE53DRAFT_98579 [Violaceomyces palustris]|uniref:Uncharacterized protein n=1 Tax=Violaceomyces palustris TaxID=1673888 RepID=A0ACD0NX66_9BASI|nr:hypothetical protein IE53DRAFT_98579 [Violaceomyces palustris]
MEPDPIRTQIPSSLLALLSTPTHSSSNLRCLSSLLPPPSSIPTFSCAFRSPSLESFHETRTSFGSPERRTTLSFPPSILAFSFPSRPSSRQPLPFPSSHSDSRLHSSSIRFAFTVPFPFRYPPLATIQRQNPKHPSQLVAPTQN